TDGSRTVSGKGWKGIAIHGTHDESTIGTRASEGCVRLENKDILELREIVYVGMPVEIKQ
ncbi:MAG: L,D-transpeptidase, partial [bacterium]